MSERGYTMWARATINSEIFYDKPDKWFKIWFFMVNRVNHKGFKKWNRGQCFTTYEEIAAATKASKNEIQACIKWLKKAQMLTTQKSTRGFHITVINYGKYQDPGGYAPYTTPHRIHTESTLKEKNDNNDNNIYMKKNSFKYNEGKHQDFEDVIDIDGNGEIEVESPTTNQNEIYDSMIKWADEYAGSKLMNQRLSERKALKKIMEAGYPQVEVQQAYKEMYSEEYWRDRGISYWNVFTKLNKKVK